MKERKGVYFAILGIYIGLDWSRSDYSWHWYTDRGDRRIEPVAIAFHGRIGSPWLLNIILGPLCFNAARIKGKPIEKHPKDLK